MKSLKVFIKQNFGTLFMAMIIPFLFSCSSKTEKDSAKQLQPIAQVSPTDQALPQKVSAQQKYEIVPNEKVCMVNDKFMGIVQMPIDVAGITYYGCCENCVKKLQENIQGVRYGTDPLSKEKVDKANAVIVRNVQDQTVTYFESKASAEKFMSR